MNGQLYYNTPNPPEYGFVDVDLHTGQQFGTRTVQTHGQEQLTWAWR